MSVINQTYKNIEILVIDDCSALKGEYDFLENLKKKYTFQLFRNEYNLGASKSLDGALKHANGDYIAYLSQDDIWVDDKLEYQLNKIQMDNLDVLFNNSARIYDDDVKNFIPSPTDKIDALLKNKTELMRYMYTRDDLPGNCLIQGALFKRSIIEQTSWVRHRFLLDDWPLTLLFWRDYNTSFDKKTSFYYRIHDNNTHKSYWKWTAPRLHVVFELAPDEYKLEGMRFILESFGWSVFEDNKDIGGVIINMANHCYIKTPIPKSNIKYRLFHKIWQKLNKKLHKKGYI